MNLLLAPQFPVQTREESGYLEDRICVCHTWILSCTPTSYIQLYKGTSLQSMKPYTLQSAALKSQNS